MSTSNQKIRSSCDRCLDSKVKCSQSKPSCRRCLYQGQSCVYSLYRRIGRPPKHSPASTDTDAASRPKRPGIARGSSHPQTSSTVHHATSYSASIDGSDFDVTGGGAQDVFNTQGAMQTEWASGDLIDTSHMILENDWAMFDDIDDYGKGMPGYHCRPRTRSSGVNNFWATGWTGECYWPDYAQPKLDVTSYEHLFGQLSHGSVLGARDIIDLTNENGSSSTSAPTSHCPTSQSTSEDWPITLRSGCPYECQIRLTQQLIRLEQCMLDGDASRLEALAMYARDAHEQRIVTLRCTICCSEHTRPVTFGLMIRIQEAVFTLYEHNLKAMDQNTDQAESLVLCRQMLRGVLEDHLHATLALEHELAGDGRACIEPCREALARLRLRVKRVMVLKLGLWRS